MRKGYLVTFQKIKKKNTHNSFDTLVFINTLENKHNSNLEWGTIDISKVMRERYLVQLPSDPLP